MELLKHMLEKNIYGMKEGAAIYLNFRNWIKMSYNFYVYVEKKDERDQYSNF